MERKSKSYFNKYPNIRSIFLNCWFSPELMAVIHEAKNRNIKTIDVQHGIQGKFHPMYSYWVKIKNYNYKLVPDKFWCWDKFSKKIEGWIAQQTISCANFEKRNS